MANFSGAVGQNLSEDTLWDAAGDLAYGTGNDTSTVLAIGDACEVLKVSCAGIPTWGSSPSPTGALDNGVNNITSGGTWSIDVDATGTDGTGLTGAGTLRFGASQDLRMYHGGTHNYITGVTGDLIITTDCSGAGIILDAEDDTVEIKYSGTTGATFGTGGLCVVSGDAYSIAGNSVLNATTLGSAVVTSSLTTVGALDSGSITSGFGTIDTGSSTITTTGTITGGSLAVDNFTLNGTELDLSTGDFTLDVAGDVSINADGGCVNFIDASLTIAAIRNASCKGELRLHEAANYVGFVAPALSANQVWTLPDADGTCGQVLSTNGSGVLSWACGGGGGCARSVAGDTDNGLITWVTSNNTFASEANLLFDGSTLTVTGDLTVTGGCITISGAATDIDLIDNNACALSFDASGQAGILAIDTQNCAEGVKMSAKLDVAGVSTLTGGFAGAAASTITTDTDAEFVALKLINQSDSANTNGFVTLEFDLEDTGGNAVDAAKISVKKEASFTATAGTQDATMEFDLSLNGTMTERMTLSSSGNLSIDGGFTVGGSTSAITSSGKLAVACQCAITGLGTLGALTLTGDMTLTGGALDVDLVDNNACAISFDASGQAGILAIDTQNCAEGVKMSGYATVTGLLTAGSLDVDDVLISCTNIGHTCDTDLLTLGNACLTIKGALTVGVDDTGHDVKLFGAAAGAFMLYDQSCNLLEVRGATAAGPGHLKLTTGETTVVACDVLGKIEFQAPAECGTDAIVAGANIQAVAQATFSATVNNTDLLFMTGLSGAATEKFRFTANGELGVGGANYGTDGQVLTSTGAGTAPAWEDAASGGVATCASPTWTGKHQFNLGAVNTGGSAYYKTHIANSNAVTANTGTTSLITGLSICEPNVSESGGTVTSVANLYIPSMATEGCNNYAIWIDQGTLRVDGQIQAEDGSVGTPSLSWQSDPDSGFFMVSSGGNNFRAVTNGTAMYNVHEANGGFNIEFGDTSNGDGDHQMTLNNATKNNAQFHLKNGDVAHGMTDIMETDSFAKFGLYCGNSGGMLIEAVTDTDSSCTNALVLRGYAEISTAKTTGGRAPISLQAAIRDGTAYTMTSNMNMVVVQRPDNGQAQMIIDVEGDLYTDGPHASYDAFCDAQLTRALTHTMQATVCTEPTVIKNRWDDFIRYNEQTLVDAGILGGPIIGVDPSERGLVNITQLQRLHNGAIWQLHTKIADQGEEIKELQGQLKALNGGK
jgi:hypothetical protein